jgi:hypothetical protein
MDKDAGMSGSPDRHARMLGYDVDLGRLAATISRRRRLVFACIGAALLLALVYLHLATYTYTATLVVSPVASSSGVSGGGLSGKLGKLGGLASLAGISLGNDPATQAFMMYQEGLYSRDVAEQLARNPLILHKVFHKQWDEAGQRWIPPFPPVRAVIVFVETVIGMPVRPWQPPNGALLQEYINDYVDLEADQEKPIVTITYRFEDPEFAVYFLRELDRAVDNKLRGIALSRANEYVGYLSDQLTKVTNTDVRDALMSTLIDQENTRMMASVTAPYSAQPFGPPSASRKPMNPNPFLVLAAALFGGTFLGGLAAVWLPPVKRMQLRVRKPFAKPNLGTH